MAAGDSKLGVPPPKKNRTQSATLHIAQVLPEIFQQRIYIPVFRKDLAKCVGVEVTVRAFLQTPGYMHIKR